MKSNLTFLFVFASLILTSCGSKKGGGPGKDWSGKPLKAVSGTVHKVAFTIDLPEKMKKDKVSGDITMMWKADMDDYFSEPSVMVSYAAIPAKSIKELKRNNFVGKKHVVATEKELKDPKGFLITYHTKNKGLLTVASVVFKDKIALACRASQAKGGGVPNFEATKKWLEKICLSVKIK